MADKVSKSAAAATKHKAKASEEKSVSTAAKFKWNNEMIGALLDSLKEFKSTMEFNTISTLTLTNQGSTIHNSRLFTCDVQANTAGLARLPRQLFHI